MKEMKKVVVGMSGEDSTVTALLLSNRVWKPVGVTLRLWGRKRPRCGSGLKALGIEHHLWLQGVLREVVEPFANSTRQGTPNPCVQPPH